MVATGSGDKLTSITPNSMTGDVTLYAIFYAKLKINGKGGYIGWEDGETLVPFNNYETNKAIGSFFNTDLIFKEGYKASWTDGNQKVKAEEKYLVKGNATLQAEFDEKTLDECFENNTYTIFTANQLNAIRNKTDENTSINARVGENITVGQWTPIPAFKGSFTTVNGKKITLTSFNNSSNVGLIENNYGHLQLNVEAYISSAMGTYAGILVRRNTKEGYLQTCNTYGYITSSATWTGGAVGCNEGTIMNHTNYATINAGMHVGGIIGYQTSEAYSQGHKNYGLVCFSYSQALNNEVGGIIGRDAGRSTMCYNYETIKFLGKVPSGVIGYAPYVGGAIGYAQSGEHSLMYYKRNGFEKGTLTQNQITLLIAVRLTTLFFVNLLLLKILTQQKLILKPETEFLFPYFLVAIHYNQLLSLPT